MASLLGWFKKQAEGVAAQLNPFDNGATYNSVINRPAPPQAPAPRSFTPTAYDANTRQPVQYPQVQPISRMAGGIMPAGARTTPPPMPSFLDNLTKPFRDMQEAQRFNEAMNKLSPQQKQILADSGHGNLLKINDKLNVDLKNAKLGMALPGPTAVAYGVQNSRPEVQDAVKTLGSLAEASNATFMGGRLRNLANLGGFAAKVSPAGVIQNIADGGKTYANIDKGTQQLRNLVAPEPGTANSLSPTALDNYNPNMNIMRTAGSVQGQIAEQAALMYGAGLVGNAAKGVAGLATHAPLATKIAQNIASGAAAGGTFGGLASAMQGKGVRDTINSALGWGAAGGISGGLLPMIPNVGKIPFVRAIPRALAGSAVGAATAPLTGFTPEQGALFGLMGGATKPYSREEVSKIASNVKGQFGKKEPGFVTLPSVAGKDAVGKPFKDASGKKVVEVSDRGAKIKPNPEVLPGGKLRPGENLVRMGDVLEHPKLYEKYPELKKFDLNLNIDKRMNPHYASGKNTGGKNPTIIVDTAGKKKPTKGVLLHEAQHYIDDKEGLARGGSPNQKATINSATKKQLQAIDEKIKVIDNGLEREKFGSNAIYRGLLEERKALTEKRLKLGVTETMEKEGRLGIDGYNRLAGETKARNVQARAEWSDAQRIKKPFNTTYDIPPQNQILSTQVGSFGAASQPKVPLSKKVDQFFTNQKEDVGFRGAVKRLETPEHVKFVRKAQEINAEYKVRVVEQRNLIGDTKSYGTEASILNKIEASPAQSRIIAARKGLAGDQFSVLNFVHDSKGKDFIAKIQMPKDLTKTQIRGILNKRGLEFRSIDPKSNEIIFFTEKGQDLRKITELAKEFNARKILQRGQGEFIGNDSSRAAARREYRRILEEGRLGGTERAGSGNTNNKLAEFNPEAIRQAQGPANPKLQAELRAIQRSRAELRPSPQKAGVREPDPKVIEGVQRYQADRGLQPVRHEPKKSLNEATSRRIADAYDKLKDDNSKDPRVRRAYTALQKEVEEQYEYATKKLGMKFEPWTKTGQPYKDSAEMMADIKKGHLYFFTGGEKHPFLDQRSAKTGHTYNEMFRAIHDYYGHGAGSTFSAAGEERAWFAHSQMFSKEAQKALTTETRGQNSWVNFGRQNYDAQGKPLNIPPSQRPFAKQKVDLLPDEFSDYSQMSLNPPKGYKINKNGEFVNIKTGKVLDTPGEIEAAQMGKTKATQKDLMKFDNKTNNAPAPMFKNLKNFKEQLEADVKWGKRQANQEMKAEAKARAEKVANELEALKVKAQSGKKLKPQEMETLVRARMEGKVQLDVEPPKGMKIGPDGKYVPTRAKQVGNEYEAQRVSKLIDQGYKEVTKFSGKGKEVIARGKNLGARDAGIDVEARDYGAKQIMLIQNKLRGEGPSGNKEVHLNAVAKLVQQVNAYQKKNPGMKVRGILENTKGLDVEALNYAKRNGIEVPTTTRLGVDKIPTNVAEYTQASKGIGQRNVNAMMRDLTPAQQRDALHQLSNPKSQLSTSLQNATPQQYRTITKAYYYTSDPENFAQREVLEGLAGRLRSASTPDAVRKTINEVIAKGVANNGRKNPLLLNLESKLNDTKFINKLANTSKRSQLVSILDSANMQPLATPFRQPTGLRVKQERLAPPEIRTTPQPVESYKGPGNKEYGYLKTVRNSRFTPPEAGAILEMQPGHVVKANPILVRKAQEMIGTDSSQAMRYAKANNDDLAQVVSGLLIKKLNKEGQLGQSTELAIDFAQRNLEAGRFIQANTLFNKISPEGIQKYAAGQMLKNNKTLPPELGRDLVKLTTEYQKMPDGEPKQIALRKILDMIGQARGSSWGDKVIALWKAGLLTSPITHVGNATANTTKAVVKKVLDDPTAAGVDALMSLVTGKRTKTYTMRGEFSGNVEGYKRGAHFMKTGYDPRNPVNKYDVQKVYFGNSKVGKGLQKYTDTVFNSMGAEDQPYYYPALRNSLYDQAKAEAINKGLHGQARKQFMERFVKNPPEGSLQSASDIAVKDAKKAVFANDTFLNHLGSELTKSKYPAVRFIGNTVIPFLKVPSAVITEAVVDRTPIGLAKEVVTQIVNHRKLGTGFDQRAMSEAIAKSSTGGVGIMAIGAALQASGNMTLASPTSDAEKNRWELEGKQPYAVKVGGTWYSVNYIQPYGTLLAMGAQFKKTLDDPYGGGPTGALVAATFAGMQAVTQQSFLKGVGGALASLTNPKSSENYIEQTVGSIVPNIVKTFARAIDPLQRQVNTPGESVIAGIPGLRQTLLPKQNVFGEDLKRPQDFLGTMFNPLRPTKAVDEPFVNELVRLDDLDPEHNILPASLKDTVFDKNKKITPQQLYDLTKAIGGDTLNEWQAMMADPRYQSLSDEDKVKALKKGYGAISQAGKLKFASENDITYKPSNVSTDAKRILRGGGTDYLSAVRGDDGTPQQVYEDALAKYEDMKKAGEISEVEDIRERKRLETMRIKSNYTKDVVDLYSLSKNDILDYVESNQDGKSLMEQIIQLDAELGGNKFHDKYGNVKVARTSSGGSGSRRATGAGRSASTSYKVAGVRKISAPRGIRVSSPRFSSKTRKLAVSKLPKLSSRNLA